MGETQVKPRSKPIVPPLDLSKLKPGSEGQLESPKVTRLLGTAGKSRKRSGAISGRSPEVPTKSGESLELERKNYWMQQISTISAKIDKDIEALAQIPGQSTYASGYRKRIGSYKLGKTPTVTDLKLHAETLSDEQANLHRELDVAKNGLKKKFSTTGDQRKKYEETHGKLEEVERQLDGYPPGAVQQGTPEGAAFYAATIAPQQKKAELLFDNLHFEAALTEITQAYEAAKAHLDDLKNREKKLTGVLGSGAFEKSTPAMKTLRQEIEKITPEVGELVTQPFATIADGLYATMLRVAKNPPKGADGKVLESIKTTQRDLQQSTQAARDLREEIIRGIKEVEADMQRNGALRPQSEVEDANKKLDKARELLAAFSLQEAKNSLHEASTAVLKWPQLPAVDDPNRKEHIGKQGFKQFHDPAEKALEIAKRHLELAKTAPVLNTPPTVQSIIDMLKFQLDRFKGAQDEFPISVGLDTVKEANARNDQNQKRYDDYVKLNADRERLGGEISRLAIAASDAIQDFKSILTRAGSNAENLATYDAPYAKALEGWSAAMERALTLKDLEGPFASVSKQLTELTEQLRKDAKNPDRLIEATSEAKVGQLDVDFRKADELAAAAVAKLTEADYEKGDASSVLLEAARAQFIAARKSQDIKAAQAAIAAISKLAQDATQQQQAAGEARGTKIREFHAANDDISVTLARLRIAAKDSKCSPYAAVLEVITQKQVMIGRVGQSSDPSVLELAIADLKELQAELAKIDGLFKKLTTKGAKVEQGDLTIDNLNKRLSDLKLKDDTAGGYEATALKEIIAKKAGVAEQVGKILLTESATQITELETEWNALKATALKHKQEVDLFRSDLALTLEAFKKDTDKKTYPSYVQAITDRLKALDGAADKQKQADAKALADIKAEIARNDLEGSKSLKRANDGAETDQLDDQLAEKQWIADLAAFNGKLKALDAVAKNITDSTKKKAFLDQKQQTFDAVAEIKKRGKKTKGVKPPYTTMSDQLRALVPNINNMIRFPMGLETHARGEIMKTVDEWDKEVAKFHKVLDGLHDAIGVAMGNDSQKNDVLGKVTAKLNTLKEAVAPNTVRPWAKDVVDAGDDKAAARSARELAVREVLRLTSLVEGVAFRPLGRNPFEVDVLTELSALSASLFDIQTNLTISL